MGTDSSGTVIGASAASISEHYDIDSEFYELFLGSTMAYSAAMFPDGSGSTDLNTAQHAKLDHHIDTSKAATCLRVIDVGCGWGSLLRRLAERGVEQPIGITLSESQARYTKARQPGDCEVSVTSWQDFEPGEPVGAVISIGAFEHFSKPGLSRAARVRGYREFFGRCWEWMKPGARLSVQTIALGNLERTAQDSFIPGEVFTDSDLPRLGEISDAAEGIFAIDSVRNDWEDYARTLRAWRRNLRSARAAATRLVGQEETERFITYFRLSEAGFRLGSTTLLRIGFRRLDRPDFHLTL